MSEPTLGFVTPTSSHPDSPEVRHRIAENLPPDLLSIEEIIGPDKEVILPKNHETLNLRERESIFYSPFRTDTWYSSLTYFLENVGLNYSPP